MTPSRRRRQCRLQLLNHLLMLITVFIGGTDQGPECEGPSNKMPRDAAENPFFWVVWRFCQLHKIHNMFKRLLALSGTFFSSSTMRPGSTKIAALIISGIVVASSFRKYLQHPA